MASGKISQGQNESIGLSLPVNTAYVSSARLTASSIANRMGFDIECAEDIKSAVSEACAYIIRTKSASGVQSFKIIFDLSDSKIEITLTCAKGTGNDEPDTDEYGVKMIKALMDTAELTTTDEETRIIMVKNLVKR